MVTNAIEYSKRRRCGFRCMCNGVCVCLLIFMYEELWNVGEYFFSCWPTFFEWHVYSSNWPYCLTIRVSCLAYKWMKIHTFTMTFGVSLFRVADLIVRHIDFRFWTMVGNGGKLFSGIGWYKCFCEYTQCNSANWVPKTGSISWPIW